MAEAQRSAWQEGAKANVYSSSHQEISEMVREPKCGSERPARKHYHVKLDSVSECGEPTREGRSPRTSRPPAKEKATEAVHRASSERAVGELWDGWRQGGWKLE